MELTSLCLPLRVCGFRPCIQVFHSVWVAFHVWCRNNDPVSVFCMWLASFPNTFYWRNDPGKGLWMNDTKTFMKRKRAWICFLIVVINLLHVGMGASLEVVPPEFRSWTGETDSACREGAWEGSDSSQGPVWCSFYLHCVSSCTALLMVSSCSFHSADGDLISTPQIVTSFYMKISINNWWKLFLTLKSTY